MSSGGPLMFMNMRAAVVFMSSDALVGVMIFLPPLSLKSRKLCLTGVTGSLNLVHKSSI